jgi:hypothetical protein
MSILIFSEQSATPSAPSSGKAELYFDNTARPRVMKVDDSGVPSVVEVPGNASTAAVSAGYASDTYLAGSSITVPAGSWRAGQTYRCRFDMTKTGAGTAAFTVNVRMGTLGTTGDASVLSLAFAVGTAVADTGMFELLVNFRSVGSGTSAVIQGVIMCNHHLAATGLITTGASGTGIILGTSSGFNSTTQTIIGISVNGGGSFSGTNTIVQAELIN